MQDGCHNCKFVGQQGQAGICRRHPPTLVVTDKGYASQFPPVTPATWCGDFEIGNRVAIAHALPKRVDQI